MISQIGMNNSSAKMVAKDSVLIALAGQGKTRGTVAINRIPLTTNQSIAAMTFNENFIPEFVFYNLENRYDELRRMSSGDGSRGGLNKQLVGDIEIPYTEKKEQERIGSFFESLDRIIALHQRKLFLNFVKKNDWEQRKLGDNIVEYTEVTTENNQYPPLTSSRKGIFLQTEYFAGNQIASDDNTGYNIVPYGYFTYRHMSDDEIFHFNINDIVENGIVSTLYPVFTTDENLDSRYLQYQLNYGHEFAKFAILQKQGGSRTYMYLNKLKQLYLTMPKSVEEQKAISAFFMNLDHLITLHRRAYYNKKGGLTNVHNDNQQHYAIL